MTKLNKNSTKQITFLLHNNINSGQVNTETL
jgi:hypothetical protein